MSAHLNEEEQLEALRRWWKDNGKFTVAILVIAGLSFFGWNQYQAHIESKAIEGSQQYRQFMTAVEKLQEDSSDSAKAKVEELGNSIVDKYNGSYYADFVRLYRAQQAVEAEDVAAAKSILEETLATTRDESMTELVKLRLARVIAAQGEIEAALKMLDEQPSKAYAAVYAEVRGDILSSSQRFSEARNAYEAALQAMNEPVSMRRSLVQLKMDNTRTASDEPERLAPESPNKGSDTSSTPDAAPEDA